MSVVAVLDRIVPQGAPIRRPSRWRGDACCVCGVPTGPTLTVSFLDHGTQDGLRAGLCDRSGCFRLVCSVATIFTSGPTTRSVSIGAPARRLAGRVVPSWAV